MPSENSISSIKDDSLLVPPAVALAHAYVARVVRKGDVTIDATVGNGNDTLFLADHVGRRGTVFGFDIQAEAVVAARRLLVARDAAATVRLFRESHECMGEMLAAEFTGRVSAVMFNLGYLPGGDKSVITTPQSTLAGLEGGISLISPGGVISVVLYSGHPGGRQETEAVRQWSRRLDPCRFKVTQIETLNSTFSPALLLIERPVSWGGK